jgi:uncharacterized protein DUF6912
MTRVYVPSTLTGLARVQQEGRLGTGDVLAAHAVTPAVREWYVEGDLEELEYSAMIDATEGSLAVLAQHPGAPRRRVVIAADVPDEVVKPANEGARSAVVIAGPVPLSKVVSIHVDEEAAAPVVEEAVGALAAARAGDDDAQFLLDEAEALDLLWYDVTEIDDLIK